MTIGVPSQLVAGDTLEFRTSVSEYPPADGWTLKYQLVGREASGGVHTVTASVDGNEYVVEETPQTTETWPAGYYTYSIWVEKSGAKQTLERGQITILPGTMSAGYDGRSSAEKAYDQAVAALVDATSRASSSGSTGGTGGVVEYQIGDRRVRYGNAQEAIGGLISLRNQAAIELKRERQALARARGEPDPYRTHMRLIRG